MIAGKLLAAKRPHLVPIYDQRVSQALGPYPRHQYWACWRHALQDEAKREAVRSVGVDAGLPATVSLLRILDIIIWMDVGEHS